MTHFLIHSLLLYFIGRNFRDFAIFLDVCETLYLRNRTFDVTWEIEINENKENDQKSLENNLAKMSSLAKFYPREIHYRKVLFAKVSLL